jgi:WD40 repeat protein
MDTRVQAWRVEDGERLLDVPFPERWDAPQVVFAGGRTLIVCLSSGDVDVHDLDHGTKRSLPPGPPLSGGIDVDPAGTLLATITDTGCSVRRLSDGGEVCAVPFAHSSRSKCSLSPDGRRVAVATAGSAVVADVADGSILFHATGVGEQLSDCCLLDDRHLLLTTDWDCELVVWDMQLDRPLARYGGHTYTANCCAVTPDGRHALSGGGDNTVRLWSLDGQIAASRPDRHTKLVYGCTVDAEALLACSAPQDEAPAVWNARTGIRRHPLPTVVSFGFVRFCQFGGSQRIATLGSLLRVFDAETATCVWETEIPVRDQYGEVSWLASGMFEGRRGGTDLAGSAPLPLLYAGAHVIVWEEQRGLRPVALGSQTSVVSWFHSGRALALLHDGELKVVDLEVADAPRSVATGVLGCVGSPGRFELYALMEDHSVRRLDAATGAVLQVLGTLEHDVDLLIDPEESAVWAVSRRQTDQDSSQDGGRQELTVFALDGSSAIRRADMTGHQVFGTCFLSGQLITAGWDATLRVWDPFGGLPYATIAGTSPFRCVDAAKDRIVAGDQRGNLWFLAPMPDLYA